MKHPTTRDVRRNALYVPEFNAVAFTLPVSVLTKEPELVDAMNYSHLGHLAGDGRYTRGFLELRHYWKYITITVRGKRLHVDLCSYADNRMRINLPARTACLLRMMGAIVVPWH